MLYESLCEESRKTIDSFLSLPLDTQREVLAQMVLWIWSDEIQSDLSIAITSIEE